MGAATTRELLDLGAEITGLDVRDTDLPVKQFITVDLADRASIDAAVDQIPGPVDALFVCSGLPGATRWSGSEVFTVNFLGARHLMERTVDKLGDGGAMASIASVAGMAFTVHQAEIMGLLTAAASFEDGATWCQQHQDLVA